MHELKGTLWEFALSEDEFLYIFVLTNSEEPLILVRRASANELYR